MRMRNSARTGPEAAGELATAAVRPRLRAHQGGLTGRPMSDPVCTMEERR